jgi:hypothetical protein
MLSMPNKFKLSVIIFPLPQTWNEVAGGTVMSHPRKPSMLPQNCRCQTQGFTAEEGNDAIGDTPTYSDSYQDTSGCSRTG